MTDSDVALRLALAFDPARLRRDLDALTAAQRRIELDRGYHDGSWSAINLISPGGDAELVNGIDPTSQPPRPTAALAHAPYLGDVLAAMAAPIGLARVLFLAPGARIAEHCDPPVNFQTGQLRLHVPLRTHPDVVMTIAGRRVDWREGELWWADFSQPHAVRNDSPIDRAHLVVDTAITEPVLRLFPDDFVAAQRRTGITMHESSPELDEATLRSRQCEFEFPRFTFPTPRPSAGTGAIRLEAGKLALYLNGARAFELFALSEREFGLVGWPPGMRLVYDLTGDRIAALAFEIRGLPQFPTFVPTGAPAIAVRRIGMRLRS
jgi:hypothetical protein